MSRDRTGIRDLEGGLSELAGLRDLAVEAASPGEIESGGLGLTLEWGFADSPFGICSIGWNPRGVCHLAFHDSPKGFPEGMLRSWPRAGFSRNDKLAARMAGKIFQKKTGMRVFVRGTAFQLKVWRALLQVPAGSLTSYSRIASAIGTPRASRAVGTACGANPVAYLIPCHRVIHENGIVKGYRWGTERKRAMIAGECPANQNGVHDGKDPMERGRPRPLEAAAAPRTVS